MAGGAPVVTTTGMFLLRPPIPPSHCSLRHAGAVPLARSSQSLPTRPSLSRTRQGGADDRRVPRCWLALRAEMFRRPTVPSRLIVQSPDFTHSIVSRRECGCGWGPMRIRAAPGFCHPWHRLPDARLRGSESGQLTPRRSSGREACRCARAASPRTARRNPAGPRRTTAPSTTSCSHRARPRISLASGRPEATALTATAPGAAHDTPAPP